MKLDRLWRAWPLALAALALVLLAWLFSSTRRATEPTGAAGREPGAELVDAGAIPPPKDEVLGPAAVASAPEDAGPWTSAQPPEDYEGEIGADAGAPAPLPRPGPRADEETLSPDELANRRRQTIALIDRRVDALDREIEEATEAGNYGVAGVLRERRAHIQRRREVLLEVLAREDP